ncbi:hypothetical protein PHMEG_0001807 [Phytophthora megakarya]|uniref:Uncharacterized protein n=1 Tax=Phytophthora megakarya TaxID=4795 RepID=A0A225X2A7_9STRA|nr:hypothetical protein PHMEG_0001807 [Phytophthora megakarya]
MASDIFEITAVINFYIDLLSDRDKNLVATRTLQRENYFFSSSFHPILAQYGYNYTGDDLFEKDKIFIPVHVNGVAAEMIVYNFFTECIAINTPLLTSQDDIPYHRLRMVLQIKQGYI